MVSALHQHSTCSRGCLYDPRHQDLYRMETNKYTLVPEEEL